MPIDTESRIDRLLMRLQGIGVATPTTTLYAEGVKAKLRQARFSLENLRNLEHQVQDATTISTAQASLSVNEQVNFYCDGFWDSLRSALDILGQLVKELRSLGISERDVDIKRVANKIKSTAAGSPLDKALDELLNSSAFNQLEEYRHCSTHRRPIYIETRTVTTYTSGTPGYPLGSTEPWTIVERYICTNPWALKPRVYIGRRPVLGYNEQLLQRIRQKIDTVVNRLP
jgi:ribosomal protein S13